MTLSFAALYLLSALSLFGLAIGTGYLFEHGRSAWRRWRCRREMRKLQPHTLGIFGPPPEWERPFTRRELESLATARDKAERKIH